MTTLQIRPIPCLALALMLLSAPARAEEAGACALANRLSMLERAYVALIRYPDAPQSDEVALYVSALAARVAQETSGEVRDALGSLTELAKTVMSSGGSPPMSAEARARHLSNAGRIGSAGSAENCPEPDPLTERQERKKAEKSEDDSHGDSSPGGAGHGSEAENDHEADEALWDSDIDFMAIVRVALAVSSVLAAAGGLWYIAALVQSARRKRASARLEIARRFSVLVQDTGISVRALGTDLSRGGIKLAWQEPPGRGSRLTINLDGISMEGRVVWRNTHFCGMAFDRTLGHAEFAAVAAAAEDDPAAGDADGETHQASGDETKTAPDEGAVAT